MLMRWACCNNSLLSPHQDHLDSTLPCKSELKKERFMHRNTFRILFLLSLLLLVTGCGLGNNTVKNTASPASSTQSTGTGTRSPVITEFALPTQGSIPYQITVGPDGNLWFTEIVGNKIGRISPTGSISEFPIPTANSRPFGIALGPGGNLWFTEVVGNKIGRISPTGTISEFPIPTAANEPQNIALGPDGNLWFTEIGRNNIGRISPSGSISEFPIPTAKSWPFGIALGPDGNLWFTEIVGN